MTTTAGPVTHSRFAQDERGDRTPDNYDSDAPAGTESYPPTTDQEAETRRIEEVRVYAVATDALGTDHRNTRRCGDGKSLSASAERMRASHPYQRARDILLRGRWCQMLVEGRVSFGERALPNPRHISLITTQNSSQPILSTLSL